MIEVELKFALPMGAQAQLQALLTAMPLTRQLEQSGATDTYYDTAAFDCLQQAVFIRIRNHAYLEIKYHEQADPAHTHSLERVFPLDATSSLVKEMNSLCARFISGWQPAETIEDSLHTNGLVPFVHIEKQRTRYEYKHITLCLDHVKGLGDFFEVETACTEETEVPGAQAELQDFVARLACPDLRPVRIGYVELWLRLHLPHIYRLGKYQEEHTLEPRFKSAGGIGLSQQA